MRTIKFRGKQAFGGADWKYGNLCGTTNYVTIEEIIKDKERENTYWTPHTQVIPETVGQFTGLLDKDGKEIYEGDIVKFTKWNGKIVIGFVKWDECNPCMCIEFKTEYKQTDWEFDFIKCGTMKIEVIGNIHDNPELISEG